MINAWFLPTLVDETQFAGRAVVVIDVLRATTTIVEACAAGARDVIPCGEVAEARALAQQLGPQAVTGGERGGLRIAGFQLGNSPSEYTPQNVGQKTVVFTTSNGTRAMQHCRRARRILLAAFTNLSAICHVLAAEPEFDVLCAGTDGHITREDVLLAGALIVDRQQAAVPGDAFNDQADIAADSWRRTTDEVLANQPLWRILGESRGGRHLLDIGQQADIELASQLDRFQVVPELDVTCWRISCSARPSGG